MYQQNTISGKIENRSKQLKQNNIMLAIFLDIETTGLDPTKHHVIDIAFKIVDISTGELKASFQSIVKQPREIWDKHDPASILINGYTWEDVLQGKDPVLISQEIIRVFNSLGIERGRSVFICQNPAFDRGFFTQLIDVYAQERLNWPYHWLDFASMYWVTISQKSKKEGTPFPPNINLSKNEIAREYHLPKESEPHRAVNGVDHLIACYQVVLGVNFKIQKEFL